jgi:hypothetical protein
MMLRLFAFAAVAALCCSGCLKSGNGDRVDQLLAEQNEHARQLSEMSRKISSVDQKLDGIQKTVDALAGAGSATTAAKAQQLVVAPNYASTQEYKSVLQMMNALQSQVATAQANFANFQDEIKASKELEALRDRQGAFQAMSQPGEMSRRLDILVKNFSGNIPDAATRLQFMQDVEALKASFFTTLSPEEKLQQARALLSERLNSTASDDRMRGMLERQLRSLDEAQNPDQQAEQADRLLQFQNVQQIGELTQKYNIPGDVVRDSGLVSFGRGMGGPMPGGRGGPMGGAMRGGGGQTTRGGRARGQ